MDSLLSPVPVIKYVSILAVFLSEFIPQEQINKQSIEQYFMYPKARILLIILYLTQPYSHWQEKGE
jgi:hypothetical protein